MPQPSKAKVHSITEGRERRNAQPQGQSNEQKPPTSVHPIETEDKKGAGTGAPRQTEALRQNVNKGQSQQHPETPAGQHATGSFPTGAAKNGRR